MRAELRPESRSLPMVLVSLSLALSLGAAGCGTGVGDGESDGMLIKVLGRIEKVAPGDEGVRCATGLCEPNYVYTASFGGSRVKPKPKKKPGIPPPPVEALGYAHAVLRTPVAWEVTQGSPDVVVAVVDTGVDLSHPDLQGALWRNEIEALGSPGVDDDGNGYVDDVYGWDFVNNRPNGQDDNGHGTHCAGIVAAQDNAVGIVGVAPGVRVMPLKFLGFLGTGDTLNAVKAIRYAIDNGAQIISNSWGGGGRSEFLNEAIQEALASGVAVVAAAGNAGVDIDASPSYPASYDGVIAVASTDSRDRVSSFSNTGVSSVMVAAPGSEIFSTLPGKRWGNLSGTSMAAPQVSGALALALSVRPELGVEELQELLCKTSNPIHLTRVRCGRMDVGALIGELQETAK